MTDDLNVVLDRIASLEKTTVNLAGAIDPQLGTRVSTLETMTNSILGSHLPAIRSDLESVKAVNAALQQVPGVEKFEDGLKEKLAEWFGARIDALENWASNLGQPAHIAFSKPTPPATEAVPETAAKAS